MLGCATPEVRCVEEVARCYLGEEQLGRVDIHGAVCGDPEAVEWFYEAGAGGTGWYYLPSTRGVQCGTGEPTCDEPGDVPFCLEAEPSQPPE